MNSDADMWQRLRQFRDHVAPDGVYIYQPDDPKDAIICDLLANLGTIVCLPDNGRGDAA
jgi:hypothetical protein